MLSRRFMILLMIGAVLAFSIVAIEGSSWAKGKNDPKQVQKECIAMLTACEDKCDQNYEPGTNGNYTCRGPCHTKFNICLKIEMDKTTGTTDPPPKGGLKPPVNVGGIKDPSGGSSSPTKPIRTLKPVDLGGAKQSGDGTGFGTTTIYRSHVGGGKH